MFKVNVYCGWWRDTIVKIKPTIKDIVLEIPCLECEGTGDWNYAEDLIGKCKCIICKGTGKQFLGI